MNCAGVGYGVAAYYDGDYGDEAFGGGDYWVAGDEDERYYDGGGGFDSSECEKRESGSADGGVVRTTDPAVRKLQGRTRSFRSMMVTRSTFYHGLWLWRRGRS